MLIFVTCQLFEKNQEKKSHLKTEEELQVNLHHSLVSRLKTVLQILIDCFAHKRDEKRDEAVFNLIRIKRQSH
ncbi:hypothetical protein T01_2458 [Trichinella spiralis]|uniref:Uncharacterized protein n=1 Tax=Trichinella spiralis TaxID=6334 RepID=A0A0V1BUY8_TRISP|nr:hypothetical protein T01_2458 [Trichinella spiralis]